MLPKTKMCEHVQLRYIILLPIITVSEHLSELGTTIEQTPADLALPKVSKEQFERVCSLLGLTCSSK